MGGHGDGANEKATGAFLPYAHPPSASETPPSSVGFKLLQFVFVLNGKVSLLRSLRDERAVKSRARF